MAPPLPQVRSGDPGVIRLGTIVSTCFLPKSSSLFQDLLSNSIRRFHGAKQIVPAAVATYRSMTGRQPW
jgi:hypothetical protein